MGAPQWGITEQKLKGRGDPWAAPGEDWKQMASKAGWLRAGHKGAARTQALSKDLFVLSVTPVRRELWRVHPHLCSFLVRILQKGKGRSRTTCLKAVPTVKVSTTAWTRW